MFSPIQFVFIAAIVLYLLDSIWEVGSIFNPNRFSKRLADYFIIAGLSIHCAFLIIVSAQSGTLPISTLFESSTFYLSLIVLLSVSFFTLIFFPLLFFFFVSLYLVFFTFSITHLFCFFKKGASPLVRRLFIILQ